jgi:hypothetical protein
MFSPIFLAAALVAASPSPVPGVEVSVKIHKGIDPYALPMENVIPTWNKDGSVSFFIQGNATSSSRIVEKGSLTAIHGKELQVCVSTEAVHRDPTQPLPAALYAVPLEFRITGLKRTDYIVREIKWCQ